MHRDREEYVAELARLGSDTHGFIAEHEGSGCIKLLINDRMRRGTFESIDPEATLLQIRYDIVDVPYLHKRDTERHARRNLDHCSCHRGLVVVRDEHPRNSKRS